MCHKTRLNGRRASFIAVAVTCHNRESAAGTNNINDGRSPSEHPLRLRTMMHICVLLNKIQPLSNVLAAPAFYIRLINMSAVDMYLKMQNIVDLSCVTPHLKGLVIVRSALYV